MSNKNRDHLKQQSVRALERALSEEYPGERTSYTRALRIFDSLGIEVMRRLPGPSEDIPHTNEMALPVGGNGKEPLIINVIAADSRAHGYGYDPIQDVLSMAGGSEQDRERRMFSFLLNYLTPLDNDEMSDVRARAGVAYLMRAMERNEDGKGFTLLDLTKIMGRSGSSDFSRRAESLQQFHNIIPVLDLDAENPIKPLGIRGDALNLVVSEMASVALSHIRSEQMLTERGMAPTSFCEEEARLLRAAYGDDFFSPEEMAVPYQLGDLVQRLDTMDNPRGMVALCGEDEWLLNYLELDTERWSLRGGALQNQ